MDQPSFEQKPLPADVEAIAEAVNRAQAEHTANRAEGIEAVKNAIRAFPTLNKHEQPAMETTPTSATSSSPHDAGTITITATKTDDGQLPAYAQAASPETKREIEHLLDLAMSKGIGDALAESEKSPYFVQDAFHDALAGKLYPELQQRGLIK